MKHASPSDQPERGRPLLRESKDEVPDAHARGSDQPERRTLWIAGGVLVLATLAAYHNSFGGAFVFDDVPSILDNASIRTLWPVSVPLSPPRDGGFTVSGRPLLNLSLAINYAISGTSVWSYHVLNVVIHTLAGLTLFGLVRRTLQRRAIGERLRRQVLPVAFVTALLWLLHPLQTEAVPYVIQRAESLMALFFLLTLYAFARAEHEAGDSIDRPAKVRAC